MLPCANTTCIFSMWAHARQQSSETAFLILFKRILYSPKTIQRCADPSTPPPPPTFVCSREFYISTLRGISNLCNQLLFQSIKKKQKAFLLGYFPGLFVTSEQEVTFNTPPCKKKRKEGRKKRKLFLCLTTFHCQSRDKRWP